MLGKITVPKYGDLGSPLVTIIIDNNCISNVLMDLGVAINVMNYETMKKFGCIVVKPTSTILQLVYRSTIMSYGVVEDVLVLVDSWEYPVDFMVIKIKSKC